MNDIPNRPFVYDPPLEPWLSVLHEDEHILVLDKPAGLLSVAGKPAEHADCLEARAGQRFGRVSMVHRLDRDTSGVIVLARTREAHANLGLQFEHRKTRKSYVARIWGEMDQDEGRVDLPMIVDWPNRPRQMVDHERGRSAVTDWRVEARNGGITRVRLFPLTGRSHQLRVHMLSLGHPILGDSLYAHDPAFEAADRLQLHAEELGFAHPADGREMVFASPAPF
ncbi:MAG TPA: RluA family pseudouridine synthase [Devosiaceae bacterium]